MDFFEYMGGINREHQRRDEEFLRLCADPCRKVPEVGDRVIVAAGFLGHGHLWVRHEAEVLEVGETSVFVRFKTLRSYPDNHLREEWVHPCLITDVLGPVPA